MWGPGTRVEGRGDGAARTGDLGEGLGRDSKVFFEGDAKDSSENEGNDGEHGCEVVFPALDGPDSLFVVGSGVGHGVEGHLESLKVNVDLRQRLDDVV